jgi:hypothetical protein
MAFELKQGAHVATTWSALFACAVALWWSFGFTAPVDDLEQRVKAAEIRDVSQELRYLYSEKKKMDLFEQQNGITVLSTQIKDGYKTNIDTLERKRKCLKEDKASHLCDEN